VRTPLGWAADRFELGQRALRWSTTTALIVSIVIVFTGGLVRVTGSGLGCPTWPTCDGTSIASTPALGIHGAIEFANRLLTGGIILAVGWVIIAARLQRPRVRAVTRLAWSQFWLVVANAVAGGIAVLVQLNPWVVALHFFLAIALLTTTAITWHRVRENIENPAAPLGPVARVESWVLVAIALALIVVGTLVSGSGPHSGDSADVPRMAFEWADVVIVHGSLGALLLVGSILFWFALRGPGEREALVRRRVVWLAVIVSAQGFIGIVQATTALPALLVALHLLGSALVWVGALRVLLDSNPALFSRLRGTARATVGAS
jgi:cytochrome c oxidase assembly protein subunit 15